MQEFFRRYVNTIRTFLGAGSFIFAFDACLALHRWWPDRYLENLLGMILGYISFVLFFSRTKRQVLGFALFCVAIYYVSGYEISGGSKYYLTPFDPLFGRDPTFIDRMVYSAYWKGSAYLSSIVSACLLALSRIDRRTEAEEGV